MIALLNAVKLFGKIYSWNAGTTLTVLVIIQVVLALMEIGAIVMLFIVTRKKQKAPSQAEQQEVDSVGETETDKLPDDADKQ